jgi:ferrous iron transport protein B
MTETAVPQKSKTHRSSLDIPEEPLLLALAGNPNCGKTALFNALTGGRAKVGNYPGVTVEKKEGLLLLAPEDSRPPGAPLPRAIRLLDLPGTYSLRPQTPDEAITEAILRGRSPASFSEGGDVKGDPTASSDSSSNRERDFPQAILAVVDATQLERSLGFVLELKELGLPLVLALNMMDLGKKQGLQMDPARLSQELGMPVIPTVATQQEGIQVLKQTVRQLALQLSLPKNESKKPLQKAPDDTRNQDPAALNAAIERRFQEVDRILAAVTLQRSQPSVWTDRIDRIVLHPLWGSLLLMAVLVFVFQSIFTWAEIPKEWIESGLESLSGWTRDQLGPGPLTGLLVDGVLAGVGAVVVFLPQILILFSLILLLEDSGYMARAAFLMDRMMSRVGLHGRAFIPLLSSFACAVPGILATRTIEQKKDRLTTLLVAPLMTCSARLPIYSLLIGAFIPNHPVLGPLRLQGLVMLSLYLLGVVAALGAAWVFQRTLFQGPQPLLLMELPTYKFPNGKNLFLGLWEKSELFLKKAGSVILAVSVLLWFLVSYPQPAPGSTEPAILSSYAGLLGKTLEPLFLPIGFNWKIVVALIPGLAAREVMIGSLATVYSVANQSLAAGAGLAATEGASGGGGLEQLGSLLAHDWSLATALSLLVWYVFACQCLSTLAVVKRETQSWKWPIFLFGYMTALAYGSSWVVYQVSVHFLGWG